MKCRLLHCVPNELYTCSFEQVPCHICDGQQDVIDLELKMISVTDDFSYSGTPLRHQSHIHVSINQIKYAHGRKKAKVRKKKCKGNEMWGGIPGWLIISMKKWKTVKMQWSTRSTCAKAIEFQFDLYVASASVISYSEDVTCSDGQVFFLIESLSQIRWCIMILQRSRGVTKWQSGSQV